MFNCAWCTLHTRTPAPHRQLHTRGRAFPSASLARPSPWLVAVALSSPRRAISITFSFPFPFPHARHCHARRRGRERATASANMLYRTHVLHAVVQATWAGRPGMSGVGVDVQPTQLGSLGLTTGHMTTDKAEQKTAFMSAC